MAYCTTDDLTERFDATQLAYLADRDGNGSLDAEVVARAIEDAAAEIDSWLGERYGLPLATTPPRLTAVASDIAFYRLHPAAPPDDVRRRYEDAVAWLKAVAMGKAGLDVGQAGPASGAAQVSAPPRIFSRDSLKGY